MTKKTIFNVIGWVFIILFFQFCAEEPTPSLYDPNYKAKVSDPVISGIEPASGTFAGIGEITISGSNFSENMAQNHVYFNGLKGTILDGITTQLRVLVPVISGDSILVQLRVDGALLFAEWYPYKIELAVIEYGGVTDQTDAFGIACDANENVYVSSGIKIIYQITPDEEQKEYVTEAQGVDGFYKSMEVGPGGKIYAIRTRFLYEIPPGGGSIVRVSGRLSKGPNDIDFDENLNLFYCATDGIYKFNADFSDTLLVEYPQTNLVSIRVFNGYAYVAGNYTGTEFNHIKKGIWRNKILDVSGSLGPKEDVYRSELYYGELANTPDIFTITFAEDGDMYIGADSTLTSHAVIVAHPDAQGNYSEQNSEPLYDVLLVPPANILYWGSGQYLYLNRRSINTDEKRLLRLTMGKNSAPYYGR
jgi:hypothetical protein